MGTAYIHPNMQRKCDSKARFETVEAARAQAGPHLKIMYFNYCGFYHRTGHNGWAVVQGPATPDEILERYR